MDGKTEVAETVRGCVEKEKKVVAAYLYGSTVKGRMHAESDIDIGLVLRKDARLTFEEEATLASLLEKKLGRPVDIRILNDLDVRFLHAILKHARCVYVKDEREKIRFEERVLNQFPDMQPFFRLYAKRVKQRVVA